MNDTGIDTRLDAVHAAMEAAPDDAQARLRFYETVAASELFLMLTAEPEGDQLDPDVFELGDQAFVLVFDREDRLAQFAGRAVPYAGLTGRSLAAMLAGQGIGLGVNLDVAPSAILLPPDAVAWLADTLSGAPAEIEAKPDAFRAPKGLPEAFLVALDARLATMTGLARMAYLVGVSYDTGAQGHMLGFVGAEPAAQGALARAVSEVLVFSGLEAAALDVAFFAPSDPVAARLASCGLRFDLPAPPERAAPSAPGSDPDRPPKLR